MLATRTKSQTSFILYGFFALILIANIFFWMHSRSILPQWDNVPPAPKPETAALSGLGDTGIAYRLAGYYLQNLGNVGGNYKSLRDYDYNGLEKWFYVAQGLDPRSDYIPFLAAYYFGIVTERPEKLTPIINYLAVEGTSPYPEKWRWLAHAVYLARYGQEDLDKALVLANKLASLKTDTAPWARQMPAFIQLKMGNKEASYEIMVRMLATEGDKLHPNEVNYMRDFICTRALEPVAAAKNPLCQNDK